MVPQTGIVLLVWFALVTQVTFAHYAPATAAADFSLQVSPPLVLAVILPVGCDMTKCSSTLAIPICLHNSYT